MAWFGLFSSVFILLISDLVCLGSLWFGGGFVDRFLCVVNVWVCWFPCLVSGSDL